MITKTAFLLFCILVASLPMGGTTPGPCAGVCDIYESVVERAKADPSLGGDALMLLAMIAEGRPVEIPEYVEARLGLPPTDFLIQPFAENANRAFAFRYIGKLATPEAIAYLELVNRFSFSGREGSEIWPSSQVALLEAKLINLSSPEEKARFLEAELLVTHDPSSQPLVGHWTVTELCNAGMLGSLPAVARYIRSKDHSSGRAETDIDFCRKRMEVIARSPNRVEALASVLEISTEVDTKLLMWAINLLASIQSEAAYDTLERYDAQVKALPQSSPVKSVVGPYAQYGGSLASRRRSSAERTAARTRP